jgi:hypothetical protein
MRDSGQLTFETMGGDTVIVPVRGKHYIEPRGYAHHPGTGPVGETCSTCTHDVVFHHKYHKCDLNRRAWTHGRGSDILARSPACSKWQAELR